MPSGDDRDALPGAFHLAVIVVAFVLYATAQLVFGASLGMGFGAVLAAPVIFAGWWFGVRGGTIAAVAAVPVNALVLYGAGERGWLAVLEVGGLPGHLALLAVGYGAGRVSQMTRELGEQRTSLLRQRAELQTESAERRKAEEFLKLQAYVLDAVTDSVVASDLDGRVVYLNRAAERMYGISRESAIGRDADGIARLALTPQQRAECARLLASGGLWSGETEALTPRGAVPVRAVRVPVVQEGKALASILTTVDISERRAAERTVLRRARQHAAASELGVVAVRQGPTDTLLDECARLCQTTLEVESVCVAFADRQGQLVVRATAGRAAPLRGTVLPSDLGQDVVLVPVQGPGTNGLIVACGAATHGFTKDDRHFIETLAAIVANAIERSRERAATEESEDRWRRLAETSFEGVVIHKGGVVCEANAAFARLFGYAPEELVGLTAFELIAQESHERMVQNMATRSSAPYALTGVTKDGRRIELEVQANDCLYRGEPARVVAVRDVTQRAMVERALRDSEERFRTLFENVTLGLYRTTPDGRILLANPALVRMLGYDSLSDLQQRDLNSSDTYALGYTRDEFKTAMEEKGEIIGLETTWHRKDGSVIHVRESARAIRGLDGAVSHYEGTVEDITDRKRAEEAARRGEFLLRRLVETAPIGMMFVRLDGPVVEANDALLRLIGRTREELQRGEVRWDALTPPEHAPKDVDGIRQLRETGVCKPFEKEYVHADGHRIPVLLAAATTADPELCVTFVVDMTERRQLEREREAQHDAMARNERLSALGTLVAGVAHEINNPLTYLVGNIELALMDVDDAARELAALGKKEPDLAATRHGLESALGGAQRIAHITKALKAVARQRASADREVVDLNAVLANVEALLRVGIPDAVTLTCEQTPRELHVLANAGELHQVLLNLARNALDAVSARGGGRVWLGAGQDDSGAWLSVRDDGPGIPAAVLPKLFTPFYTTKPHGTGLGLSIVHGIVRDHGGEVTVASDEGHGASFVVRLPVLAPAGAATPRLDGRPGK